MFAYRPCSCHSALIHFGQDDDEDDADEVSDEAEDLTEDAAENSKPAAASSFEAVVPVTGVTDDLWCLAFGFGVRHFLGEYQDLPILHMNIQYGYNAYIVCVCMQSLVPCSSEVLVLKTL